MLAIPLKKSRPVELGKALQSEIALKFGGGEVALSFDKDVQSIHANRTRTLQIKDPMAEDVVLLETYVTQLLILERKKAIGCFSSEFPFIWFDVYRPKKSVVEKSFNLELYSQLFNLAAAYSYVGMQMDRTNVETIKLALQNFQKGVGVFTMLEERRTNNLGENMTSDLSLESIQMLKTLLLAQAQVCYFEKAMQDNMKPSILVKLATSASLLYADAYKLSKAPSLSAVLDKSWGLHFEFRTKEYETWAEYYAANDVKLKADQTGEGYGEAIVRYKKSEAKAREASEVCNKNKMNVSLLGPLQQLMKKISPEMNKSIEDNNKIYMNPVPNDVASIISSVTPSQLAKGVEFKEASNSFLADLLIPWVREAQVIFESSLVDLVKRTGNLVEERTSDIRVQLNEAGLPQSVESYDDDADGIPDSTWDRLNMNVNQHYKGVAGLLASFRENQQRSGELKQLLDRVEERIKREEEEDAAFASANAGVMGIKRSAELNGTFKQNIVKYRSYLSDAQKTDALFQEKIQSSSTQLNLLSKTRKELSMLMPQVKKGVNINDNPQLEKVRKELTILLIQMGNEVQALEVMQGEFLDESEKISIIDELIAGGEKKQKEVIEEKLRKVTKERKSNIDKKIKEIENIFMKVLEKNHEFILVKKDNEYTKERENFLSTVHVALERFSQLAGLLDEGTRFYLNLEGKVKEVTVMVEDYCYCRSVEKDDRLEEVKRKSQGGVQGANNDYQQATIFRTTNSAPPPAYHPPPPAYGNNRSNNGASVASASPVRPPRSENPKVILMRSIIGNADGITDTVLNDYIVKANGDVNTAVNYYFSDLAFRQADSSSKAATTSNGNAGGGWLR